MTERIWAPWRLEYVGTAGEAPGCIFCTALEQPDEGSLVVQRGEHAFALLNRFPYTSGHFMVAPTRHTGDISDLDEPEVLEIHRLATEGLAALERLYAPQGHNLGWNLGRVAGAGIVDHVHLHVVPRWGGDTNFMPVLADVRVIPEHLADTHRRLRDAWSRAGR